MTRPAEEQTLVRVRDLTVRFGDTVAVENVSFTLQPGRCVALVGESGSGKSVTARSLLGLVGQHATVTAETLELGDTDLTRLSEREWRGIRGVEIGLVLQDALVSLDPLARVGKQVEETLRTHRLTGRRELRAAALEQLRRAGIDDAEARARQYPHQLSGGLRQRALIASAVAGNPRVLIADEPTTALDVTVQQQILTLLDELRADGTGLILVSHDLAVVSQLADEILVLNGGKVVEQGAPEQILGAPRTDYTRRLLAAVPSRASRGQRLSPSSTSTFSARSLERASSAQGSDEAEQSAIPALQALDLVKHYARPGGGITTALDEVSFALRRGGTLGIVGESGSGKSTAADVVLGFTRPDSGEVLLGGAPWSSLRESERRPQRHRIQAISQDPLSSFDPRANVEAILAEALGAVQVPREERRDRAVELLQQVGLSEQHLTRSPLELSGGQRQRVAISRALATDPEVLVCDEAVSALDVSIQAQVLDLLADLQSELRVSLLFISHDLGVIRHVADEVVVMHRGRIVEAGETDQVFDDPQDPYTQRLIAAIPTLDTRSHTSLSTTELHTESTLS